MSEEETGEVECPVATWCIILSAMWLVGGMKTWHSEFGSLQGLLVCKDFFLWLGAGCV